MPDSDGVPLNPNEQRIFDAVTETVTDEDRLLMAANHPRVQEAVDAMLQNASEVSDQTDPFVASSHIYAAGAAELYGLDPEVTKEAIIALAVKNWLEMEGLGEDD